MNDLSLLAHNACKIVQPNHFHSRFCLRKSSLSIGDVTPRAEIQLDSLQSVISEALGQRWPSIFKEVCCARIVSPSLHAIHNHIGLLFVHAQTKNTLVGQRCFGNSGPSDAKGFFCVTKFAGLAATQKLRAQNENRTPKKLVSFGSISFRVRQAAF